MEKHTERLEEIGFPSGSGKRPTLKQVQMRATADPVTFFTFMPHQTRLVRRLAEKCRRQHGILLIHSMGSGKTISSLGVWLNFPRPEGSGANVTNRLVIVTPPGLDSAFREDLEDMGFTKRVIDQQVREQRIVFIDYDDIEFGRRKPGETTRMSMQETMAFMQLMLKDAFVIADEAHNFVAILKKWARQEKTDLYTILLDAFNDAKKVVLLSGTPLQREWNDLTILTSLAAGYKAPDIERKLPVYPTYQSQINITYPVDFTRSLWLRQKFLEDPRVLATGLATIGVAAGLFLAPPALVVTSLVGGAMSLYGLYQATAGTSKVIGSLVEGTLAGVSATVSSFVGDVPRFSVQKMGEDISKHVSYFNYTDLDFHLTETFPLKQVITLPNRYSPFQLDMLIKQSRLEDVLDDLELEFTDRKSFATDAFKLGESVKVKTDNMEHYRRMRVIGNLSEDNYYYVTARAQKPDAFGNRVYYVFPRYEDEARRDVTDFSSGFSSDGVVRTAVNVSVPSEDYKRALHRYDNSYVAYKYEQYRNRIGGHKDKVARNAAAGNEIASVQKQIDQIVASVAANAAPSTAQQEKIDALKKKIENIERASQFDPTDLSVFRLHNVEIVRAKRSAGMTFATNKFLSALHTLCEERTKYHYLPLFYSNFDEYGFRLFSAFLTQRGYYHILIDPFDDPDVRQQLIKLGNLPYRRFKSQKAANDVLRYVPMTYGEETPEVVKRLNLDRNRRGGEERDIVPLCILLHPAIVEGLSFNLSPSIVVNEPIDGYGRAEQLYARILRAIRGTSPYDFGKDQKRLVKKIVADALKKDDKTLFADILKEKQPNVADDRVEELFLQSKNEVEAVAENQFAAFLTSKFPQYLAEQVGAMEEADANAIRERSRFFQYLLAGALQKQIENLGNKPPKTTAECVAEGFYEETDIPKDFPRMIVRENVLYQTLSKAQSKEARDDKGRYTIELLDNSIGYIDEQDYCTKRNNQYCRSPVYVELKDDYRLKRCKKKVFLQQSTFGKWKVFSKERLQQLGTDFGIEPLKTAVDVEVSTFELPPVLSLVEPYLAGLGKYVPFSSKEGELERAQRTIAGSAPGTGISAESTTLAKMQFLRYFRDDTYPGGFWNISDPTRTNELNGTETPDEIVEKNNRVNMFNWMLLADVLRQKFEEDETSICDAKCVGQCMWRQPDEGRCLPWLQENVSRETAGLGSEPGTCFKQNRLDRSVGKDSLPEMYQYIERSDRAYGRWKKYRDALRNTSDPAKRRRLIETFAEKFDVGDVVGVEAKGGEARAEGERKKQESWSSYLLGMVGLAGSPQDAATPFLMDENNRAKSGIEPMV